MTNTITNIVNIPTTTITPGMGGRIVTGIVIGFLDNNLTN